MQPITKEFYDQLVEAGYAHIVTEQVVVRTEHHLLQATGLNADLRDQLDIKWPDGDAKQPLKLVETPAKEGHDYPATRKDAGTHGKTRDRTDVPQLTQDWGTKSDVLNRRQSTALVNSLEMLNSPINYTSEAYAEHFRTLKSEGLSTSPSYWIGMLINLGVVEVATGPKWYPDIGRTTDELELFKQTK